MEYNFHWAGKQQMEMLMQPLPPTWGKYSPHTIATWASSLFRCKVCCIMLPLPACPINPPCCCPVLLLPEYSGSATYCAYDVMPHCACVCCRSYAAKHLTKGCHTAGRHWGCLQALATPESDYEYHSSPICRCCQVLQALCSICYLSCVISCC